MLPEEGLGLVLLLAEVGAKDVEERVLVQCEEAAVAGRRDAFGTRFIVEDGLWQVEGVNTGM